MIKPPKAILCLATGERVPLLLADTFLTRYLGWRLLLSAQNKRNKRGYSGLWLQPCWSIHTFGLTQSLDLVWLNRQQKPIRIQRQIGLNRVFFCWQAHSVIELPAGFLCAEHEPLQLKII